MQAASARPAVLMLFGAVAFALMGVFSHALNTRCDWLFVGLVRASVMFVSGVVLAMHSRVRLVFNWPATLWMRSLAGSFSLVCSFYAIANLPVADAITLCNMNPIWIAVISLVWLRQPPRFSEILGVACGIYGVILIRRPEFNGDGLASFAAVLSSVAGAVAMIGLHQLRTVDHRAVVVHFAGVSSLISMLLLVWKNEPRWIGRFDLTTFALLAGVGLAGTFGQVCLTRAYASGPPTRVSVYGMSQTVFGMGFDVLLFGRSLSPRIISGFILVLAPTAWLARSAGNRLAAAHAEEDARSREIAAVAPSLDFAEDHARTI